MAVEKTSASKALDALEIGLNELLLHTGSVFSEAANCDEWTIVRPTLQTKQALPKTLTNFQDALDILESELVRAQAVMLNGVQSQRHHDSIQPAASSGIKHSKDNPPEPAIIDPFDVMVLDTEEADMQSGKADMNSLQTSASTVSSPTKVENMENKPGQADASTNSTTIAEANESSGKKEEASSDTDKSYGNKKTESAAAKSLSADQKQLQTMPRELSGEKPGQNATNTDNNSFLSGVELNANSNGNDALEGIGDLDEFSTSNAFGDDDLMDRVSACNDSTLQDSFDAAAFTDSMFQELNMNDMDSFLGANFGADGTDATAGQGSLDDSQFDETFFNIDGI